MKKIFGIIIVLFIILICTFVSAKTNNDMYELQLQVMENENQEKVEIYLLLPEEYIKYAIHNDNINVEMQESLADTLLKYDIPSINIDKFFFAR